MATSSRVPRVNLKSWRRPHVGEEPAVLSRRKTLKVDDVRFERGVKEWLKQQFMSIFRSAESGTGDTTLLSPPPFPPENIAVTGSNRQSSVWNIFHVWRETSLLHLLDFLHQPIPSVLSPVHGLPFYSLLINRISISPRARTSARLNIEQSIGQRFISKSEFFVNERFFLSREVLLRGVWISISRRICDMLRFAFYRSLNENEEDLLTRYWAKGILSRSWKRMGNLNWCE